MKNKLIEIMFAVFVLGSVSALFTLFGENKQTTNTNIDKTQTIEENNTDDTWGTLETPQSTPEAIAEETPQSTSEAIAEETPQSTSEETKKECIDRVTNELIERDRGEVVTKEKMELYHAEYIGRCNLTPNR
jgi:hypothetical protein